VTPRGRDEGDNTSPALELTTEDTEKKNQQNGDEQNDQSFLL